MKISSAFVFSAACLVVGSANAADWPRQPIHIVVPYPAGGAVDIIMRTVGASISKTLAQPVVVENRPGASSNIGAAVVARAAPDGYTVLATSQWLTLNPLVEKNLSWREEDLAPVARLAKSPNYLVTAFDSPAKTLQSYVQMAHEKPGMFYGSTGVGSTQELVMSLLTSATGISLTPILYKGAPPILIDLISNRLSIAAVAATNVASHTQSKQLRLLASSSDIRSPKHPEVPTLMEMGYSKVDVSSWYGLQVPRKTPPAIIARLEQSVREAMSDPTVIHHLTQLDSRPAYLGAKDFASFLAQEHTRWAPVVQSPTGKQ
ncbi:tripartite tricarboxylate transporter substrate binding protein [Paralcaligenes sp. KSB-10]|uniref:Bug family tripartite tricarboxylate transporter substrate binding protein n=1 Tax=Paralcaligenes sp. KSB-10 TaxID=2901142 RepID=UPI001E5D00A1|nr:tripartite tricarboxylate transporter substrate binding protein [Paralcaligenes sp. KSB-10]UHL64371.1 tripartite tricarboxylate transporter substrate binding protein [Paralcaligenes sp. KSB-10]